MPRCARNLPQHFNGCTCTRSRAGRTFAEEARIGSGGLDLLDTPTLADDGWGWDDLDEGPEEGSGEGSLSTHPLDSGLYDSVPRAFADRVTAGGLQRDHIGHVLATMDQAREAVDYYRAQMDSPIDTSSVVDVDDIAQDAMVEVLVRVRNGTWAEESTASWLRQVTRNTLAERTADGRDTKQGERAAYARLLARIDAYEEEHGSEPSDVEVDEMAHQVRMESPDERHRPRIGFHRDVAAVTLPYSDDYDHAAETAPVSRSVDNPTVSLDAAFDHLEGTRTKGKTDLRAAKKSAWNALAEAGGAPLIDGPFLGNHRITAANKVIPDEAAFDDVLDRYVTGSASPEEREALTMPWSNQEPNQARSAVALLTRNPAYAYDLWKSAKSAASKSR